MADTPFTVTLNSVKYYVRGDITRFKVEPYASPIRTVGPQRLEGLTSRSSFIFPSPIYGAGLRRIPSRDIDKPHMVGRFADSTVDTRFSPTTLALLNQDSTEPTLAGSTIRGPGASREFKGELWTIFEGRLNSPSDNGEVTVRKYTGSTTSWTGGSQVATNSAGANGLAALDIAFAGDFAIVLMAGAGGNNRDYITRRTSNDTLAAGWAAPTTDLGAADIITDVLTAGEAFDGGKLVPDPSAATTCYAIIWDEVNSELEVWKTTNSGSTWTSVATMVSSAGVTGATWYRDLNSDPAPVWATASGLYALDVSASVIQQLMQTPYDTNNGRGLVAWSNPYNPHGESVYFALGNGDIYEYTMISATEGSVVRNVGPNKGDGLPLTRTGRVTGDMVGSDRWLFVPYGGSAASRNSGIWAWNGMGSLVELDGCGWHHMWRNGTANEEIEWLALSSRDDGTMRLHFSIRTSATSRNTRFLEEPLAPPLASRKYETPGVLDHPRFDGGMPRDNGAWIAVFRQVDDLQSATTGTIINIDYGVDGATPSTEFGDITSATKEVALASGAGVSGREIQIRENLQRDTTNTNSPKAWDLELMYRKRPLKAAANTDNSQTLDGFRFLVDVAITVVQENRTAEAVVKDLQTAEANVPLQAFSYGKTGTRYVEVKLGPWIDHIGRTVSSSDDAAAEVDTIQVEVREIR